MKTEKECKHEWKLIGWTGRQEKGEDVYLWQCSKCKDVKYDIDVVK